MEEPKKIQQKTNRKTQYQKLQDALKNKPTAYYMNARGITPDQVKQLGYIPENKQRLIKDRLVRNGKNRKKFDNRPNRIIVGEILGQSHLNPPMSHGGLSEEYPTPKWFRNTEKADVSVIVPLYKSQDVIGDLIRHWPLDNGDLKVEVIFVDDKCPNNSKDVVMRAWEARKSQIKNPIGKIIVNTNNKGYGMSNNAGVAFTTGDYLVLLNADTRVTPGWIKPMIDLLQDPQVGIVGNLHLKDGGTWNDHIDSAGSEWRWEDMTFVHIGRHSYQKRGIGQPFRIENAPQDILKTAEREMVTGCCFAMRADLYRYIGGFNPNYRVGYWEDSELCMAVKELGYKIMFTSESVIYHKLGHTHSGGHKFYNHNQQYFKNKWVNSGRLNSLLISEKDHNRKEKKVESITVKRTSAHGDVLVAAGVCAALKKKHPKAKINFVTQFPEVVEENPYIDSCTRNLDQSQSPQVFYNLDLAYEWRPNVNILAAYAEAVGVKPEDCDVWIKEKPFNLISMPKDFIVIHPGKTDWVGRDWPHENFIELSQRLLKAGERVLCVGKYSEGEIPCTHDIRGRTTINQLAWVLARAKLFIGIDSFPMHIAQAVRTPGLAFFGSVAPEHRIYTPNMHGIAAKNLACIGCHHRRPAPSTVTKVCETKNQDCIRMVTVDDMWEQTKVLLGMKNESISLLG